MVEVADQVIAFMPCGRNDSILEIVLDASFRPAFTLMEPEWEEVVEESFKVFRDAVSSSSDIYCDDRN